MPTPSTVCYTPPFPQGQTGKLPLVSDDWHPPALDLAELSI